MRIYLLLLLWLSSCATASYTHHRPTEYYINRDAWACDMQTHTQVFQITSGRPVLIVGYSGDWSVLRTERGKYLIDNSALTLPDELGSTPTSAPAPGSERALYTGPRGGEYYINGNGNKTYVTPQSTIDYRPIQTGPRGGQYYINDNGRKTYIKR